MARLTRNRIGTLKRPGLHADGAVPTLYLRVSVSAKHGKVSRHWVQRLLIDGKRRDMGLGGWPVVSIEEAREQAFENRRTVRRGDDPFAAKARAALPTFREAAEHTYRANVERWRNAKHRAQWMQTLELHAKPIMGARIDRIGPTDVLRCLTPIWTTKAETARKLRQRIRSVFGWAMAHEHVAVNPAGEAIGAALPTMPKQKAHYRALGYDDVPAALGTVEGCTGSLAARSCFRFVVLTACRSGEARGATWAELDLEARTWTIPAGRMKGQAEHRVPLAPAAVAVLERMEPLRDDGGLVFPSPSRRGRPMSDMTLTSMLRANGLAGKATVHGFRSSFRDWASERTDTPAAITEMALAHSVGSNVERAYHRTDLLDKRRALMARWAEFCTADRGKVVSLHGNA